MRRTRRVAAVALVAGLALAGCGSSSDGGTGGSEATLTVFAAASLTESFNELKATFESQHEGVTVVLEYGGSSTLGEQIVQGAPADVFASASTKTMDTVTAAGKGEGEPVVFASNELAIVTPPDNTSVTGIESLAEPDLTVVLCDSAVPCGATADTMFADAGITPSVDSREPDVKSVLAKVESGDADAGVVYVTDAQASGDKVREVTIPAAQNKSTTYPIVAIAGSANAALAADWIALVTGQDGQNVLKEHGFSSP